MTESKNIFESNLSDPSRSLGSAMQNVTSYFGISSFFNWEENPLVQRICQLVSAILRELDQLFDDFCVFLFDDEPVPFFDSNREGAQPPNTPPIFMMTQGLRNRRSTLSQAMSSTPRLQNKDGSNYLYQSYVDNWSYGAYQLPVGVTGEQAFAVINNDGSFDPNYPVARMQGCTALAVGGWNNSQSKPGPDPWDQNIGLYKVLTSTDDGVRQTLIENLFNAAVQNGYTSVILDYENYDNPPPNPDLYTNFLIQLEAKLKTQGITLQIAISPWPENQQFYHLDQLIQQTKIQFQLMCYDYGMGQPNPIRVMSNASVWQTRDYLTQNVQNGMPLNRMMVGLPCYGLAYTIDPSLSPEQVQQQLAQGTLNATGYWTGDNNGGNGQVSNDYMISQWIKDWENPQNGWKLLQDNQVPKETYYYHPDLKIVVAATPPQSIKNLATMIKSNFSGVRGFFDWEAMEDQKGAVMSQMQQEMQNSTRGRTTRSLRQVTPINITAPNTGPQFETYWESWNIWNPKDYCSQLGDIPAGNGAGKVNAVSIAFADYTFSTDQSGNMTIGYVNEQMTVQQLKDGINSIHQKGGKVKLSLGGATFSMATKVKSQQDAETLAQNIAKVCQQDGFDGVDFDIEDGGTPAELQLYVYRRCRELLGPQALISYTIPALGELYEPYTTVIKQGSQYFSSINLMCYDYYWNGYNPETDFQTLMGMGVPKEKIFWGVMPGHADDPNEYVTIENAKTIAQYVKQNGLGGVMMWDITRDTNHRTGYVGQDNIYETGQPDGSYLNAISDNLSQSK